MKNDTGSLDDLIDRLRAGDGNGCIGATTLMVEAADVIESLRLDSFAGQAEHARWQERAEKAEAELSVRQRNVWTPR